MSAYTGIQWATHTFNPWIGCQKVSSGCTYCYAEVSTPVRVKRAKGMELWGPAKTARRERTAASTWAQVRRWNRNEAAFRDGGARYERPRVFPSLCDVFEDHPGANAIRSDFWRLIEETPELDWLLLTKRPENVRRMVPGSWLIDGYAGAGFRWPTNVWLGTSVEDQAAANERIPHILAVPAPVRFLSLEPLLGPVDLDPPTCPACGRHDVAVADDGTPCCREHGDEMCFGAWLDPCASGSQPGINWLIVGGESGAGARPCDVAWIRDLVWQGREAGVPVFVKQVGSNPTTNGISLPGQHWPRGGAELRDSGCGGFLVRLQNPKGGDPAEWPEDLRVREMPRG